MVQVFRQVLFFALLLPAFARAGNVQVSATVDRNQVGLGDVINLTVSVSADSSINVDEPHIPPLSGFDLINTSSGTEVRSFFANGKFQTAQTRNFTYMLAVQQKGVLEIPPISVTVEGQSYKTKEIKVSATNARSQPQNRQQAQRQRQQQQDPFGDDMDSMEEMFNQMLQNRMMPRGAPGQGQGQGQGQPQQINPEEAFFISAEADKTKAVVGEQITVSYYLYTRGQIRDIDTLKYPDLKGFWKEEIDMATRLNFESAVINGIPYQKALLVSYALFPIKAGKATIDPYKAKCTVITPANFGFGRPYVFTKASRPISVEVSEVPVNGKPANYSGAVGHFRVTAAFEPPVGAVNQPVTLRVRFEGQGNAKLIELPKLDLPPSFELYDQKNSSKYMKDGTSYKEFEVMIIPRQPGVFNIAPVTTSVFDPQSQKYTNIASQPLNISVTGSATTPAPPALPGQAGVSGTSAPGGPAQPAEPALPTLSMDLEVPTLSNAAMAGFTAIIYLGVFGMLGWRGFTSLKRKPKRASLKIVMKRRLKTIREFATKNDFRRVGVELTNAIYYVLGQISEQGGANLELSRLLEHTPPSLRDELAGKLEKLIERCEALSFAPEKMISELTEKSKLDGLIGEFETVMSRAIELAEI